MRNKVIVNIIRVAVSLILVAALFFIMRKELKDVFQLLLNVNRTQFVIAALAWVLANFFVSIRLKYFLSAQDIQVTVKEVVGLTLIGFFFNNFLPSSVGGDVVKAYYASKKTQGKTASFVSVFMDRLIGSLAIVSVAILAFIFSKDTPGNKVLIWPMTALFFTLMFLIFVLFNKMAMSKIYSLKLFKWAERLHSTSSAFKNKKMLLVKTFLVSLVAQFFAFVAVYFLIKGLDDFVPVIRVMFIMPFISIASMFPSLNGLGVREGAFVVLFKPLIGAQKSFALSLLWLFLYLALSVVGGFVYAFARHGKAGEYEKFIK
ncbi:MAG: hypothetical protein COS99_06155 [Candidatus Omnitrophica bacterium CG07_land_8_20_14_0_80_42_15]|uniref:TIGR00374 family protein n=1 Tax=Candidatus Aquitaenariimonas noxiae TaxID=1974741 RepID=A0A2J0KSA7_9BACT|nr:MAG: hypothetical protein COS99_06155 [Candidatus Omnitrophica bacterium CG07_land_8_20_14_0_80_42_15]